MLSSRPRRAPDRTERGGLDRRACSGVAEVVAKPRSVSALPLWRHAGGSRDELPQRVFMRTSGITATLPAQDLGRAKAFYVRRSDSKQSSPDFSRQAMDGWASRSEMVSTSSTSIPPG